MSGWLTALCDRPLAEAERRAVLAGTVAVLLAATVALALTRPAHSTPTRHPAATHAIKTAASAPTNSAASRQALAVSRAFLAGYLAYTDGHTAASQITDATRSLIASLQAHPPRLPPAVQASHPRLLGLHTVAATSGQRALSAVIDDGGIDYTVGLAIARERGRLLVGALEQG
jgi:hypothetical protein